jgi:molybdopterin synthase catalytic subunit
MTAFRMPYLKAPINDNTAPFNFEDEAAYLLEVLRRYPRFIYHTATHRAADLQAFEDMFLVLAANAKAVAQARGAMLRGIKETIDRFKENANGK